MTVGCHVPDDVSIMLLGCGDIRNILYTIHTFQTSGISPKKAITFHLNDNQQGILSRAILLLYIVDNTDPQNDDDMKFLWSVWHDCCLIEKHGRRLREILKTLHEKEDSYFTAFSGNEITALAIRKSFELWIGQDVSVAELLKKRDEFLQMKYKGYGADFPEHPISRLVSRFTEQHPKFLGNKRYPDLCRKEVTQFVELGVTNVNHDGKTKAELVRSCVTNHTWFKPGDVLWKTEENSSAFLAFDCDLSR